MDRAAYARQEWHRIRQERVDLLAALKEEREEKASSADFTEDDLLLLDSEITVLEGWLDRNRTVHNGRSGRWVRS